MAVPNDDAANLVARMTLEEQVSLLSGQDFWSVNPIPHLDVGTLRMTDGPNGARGGGGLVGGVTAAAFPVGIAIGASWDPELAREIGAALADEVRSKGAHVSLAPTVNLHRSVTNGRNFECYSEDPELTAALAVGVVRGLQDKRVAATVKHFVGNESEVERTSVSSEIDERTLRELYLRPFEAAVKEGGAWAIMTSYNRLNGVFTSEHEWLLGDVLRDEWGFDGLVMSDWFGSHSTAPTVNAGLDLEMPGPTRDRGERLVEAVETGEVSREIVAVRAAAVLRLMERTGALDDTGPHEERADDLPSHRALIRRAGSASAVLLKNDGLLPLPPPFGTVAVIGPNAKTARIMGGGSAQLNPHYAVSPWDGLVERLGEGALVYAHGCTNHRWEPVWHGEIAVEYYDGSALSGEPVARDTLSSAEAFWVPPIAGGHVDPKRFSARLTGTFTPERSGRHRFGLHSAGTSKLFVDGDLVVDAWTDWQKGRTFFEEGCDEVVGERDLVAGRPCRIVIEFASNPDASLLNGALRAGVGMPLGDDAISEAAAVAAEAETAIVFVGRSGEWDTEGSDLEDIALPGRQDELVAAVRAANPRSVVVLQTGGPVEMPWADDVKAILQAWYPGQETGNAIADTLFGDADPGGRLPQTFPVRWEDNPTAGGGAEVYPGRDGRVHYAEGVFTGYRHYLRKGIAPLFAFGHGLSYTRFDLSDIEAARRNGGVSLSVTATNVGERAGSTVVQIYVRDREASVDRPDRELEAFRKVRLEAGEARRLTVDLGPRAFAFFDPERRAWKVDAGAFEILAGFSATDIRCRCVVDLPDAELPL